MANDDNGTVLLILLWLVWPAGLIWYLVDEKMRKTRYVTYQFKQWLAALIVSTVAWFAVGILTLVLIGLLLIPVVAIVQLVWLVQGIVFAVQKQEKGLWLIGELGEKFGF